jgi:hypothetical protein
VRPVALFIASALVTASVAACSSSEPAAKSTSVGAIAASFVEAQTPVQEATDRFFGEIKDNTTNLEALGYAVPLVKALQAFDTKIQAFHTTGQLRVDMEAVVTADQALERDLTMFSSAAGTFQADTKTAGVAYAKVRADVGLTVASPAP